MVDTVKKIYKCVIVLCLAAMLLVLIICVQHYRIFKQQQWHPDRMFLIEEEIYILQDNALYRYVQETKGKDLEDKTHWEFVEGSEGIQQLFVQDAEAYILWESGDMYFGGELYPKEYVGNSGYSFLVAQQLMSLNESHLFSCIANAPIGRYNAVIMRDGSLWSWDEQKAAFTKVDLKTSGLQGAPIYVQDGYVLTDNGNLYRKLVSSQHSTVAEYECISEGENIVSFVVGERGGCLAQTAEGELISFNWVRKYPNDKNDRTMVNAPLPVSGWKNIVCYELGWDYAIGVTKDGKILIALDENSSLTEDIQTKLASWRGMSYITHIDGVYIGLRKDGGVSKLN